MRPVYEEGASRVLYSRARQDSSMEVFRQVGYRQVDYGGMSSFFFHV